MKNSMVYVKRVAIIVLAWMMLMMFVLLGIQIINVDAATGKIQFSIYSMHGSDSSSSGSSSGGGLGHAWLVIENGTNLSYDFYNTTLSAGETCSIGTFGNQVDPETDKKHNGAWLNLEAYYGWGDDSTASLTITITATQLAKVSEECIAKNSWNVINNCSYFASQIWNKVAPDNMQVKSFSFPAHFPSKLKSSIKGISGHKINRKFAYNDRIGYCPNSNTFKAVSLNSKKAMNSERMKTYTSFPESVTTFEIVSNVNERKYNYLY